MRSKNRTWAEVSLDAIKNNIISIRRRVTPSAKILGVVKADAYGHGYLEVARTLLENGADALAVACTDEAIQLRLCKITCPILILGYTLPDDAETLLKYDITPTCFDLSFAKAISTAGIKLKKTGKVHIKIDTGMGRIGYRYCDDLETNQKTVSEILEISALPNIEVEGIFTHFSVADTPDDSYTYMQFDRFLSLCNILKEHGLDIPLRHCCNSAALIRFPQMHLDMVRPGIILYGHSPSSFTDISDLKLIPAMTLKAKISNIKTIDIGESVSYGRHFTADKRSVIATIPIGYADGFSRTLSGHGQVIASGKMCNIVGNICMDQCMFDATDVNTIAIGDEVILFGMGDNIELPVESLAEKMGTINYEILCMTGKRVPRIYIEDGAEKKNHNHLLDSPVSD